MPRRFWPWQEMQSVRIEKVKKLIIGAIVILRTPPGERGLARRVRKNKPAVRGETLKRGRKREEERNTVSTVKARLTNAGN